jgi:hypothetical protein
MLHINAPGNLLAALRAVLEAPRRTLFPGPATAAAVLLQQRMSMLVRQAYFDCHAHTLDNALGG